MEKTASVDIRDTILQTLKESGAVIDSLQGKAAEIKSMAEILIQAYQNGKKAVFFGNGGSAADAQHFAAELMGGFEDHFRRSLPALALTTDTSALTAIGNDYDFESIFSRQVEALVDEGDVVVAISTSGNSPNVLKGAKASKTRGAFVIGLTGETGGKLKEYCDQVFCVSSRNTAYIQQAHTTVGHILCSLVEKSLK